MPLHSDYSTEASLARTEMVMRFALEPQISRHQKRSDEQCVQWCPVMYENSQISYITRSVRTSYIICTKRCFMYEISYHWDTSPMSCTTAFRLTALYSQPGEGDVAKTDGTMHAENSWLFGGCKSSYLQLLSDESRPCVKLITEVKESFHVGGRKGARVLTHSHTLGPCFYITWPCTVVGGRLDAAPMFEC